MSKRPITDVLADHTPSLMAIPGVVMVYESALPDGTPCIKIGVVEETPITQKQIPETLEGYTILVQETGEIKPR